MDVDTMSDLPALLERFRRGPELLAVVLTGVFGDEEDFLRAPGNWKPSGAFAPRITISSRGSLKPLSSAPATTPGMGR